MTPAVSVRGITKRYGKFVALDNVSLDVQQGEFLSLLGPSGAGKTTILRMIAGFDRPDSGEIHIMTEGCEVSASGGSGTHFSGVVNLT